jgi:hypothetical protein
MGDRGIVRRSQIVLATTSGIAVALRYERPM